MAGARRGRPGRGRSRAGGAGEWQEARRRARAEGRRPQGDRGPGTRRSRRAEARRRPGDQEGRRRARPPGQSGSLRRMNRRCFFRPPPAALLLAATVFLVAACGFQLRGTAALPFQSLYVQATPSSQFATLLKRNVRAGSNTRIAEQPADAEVVLQVLSELQEKQILSLGGG